jgi:putative mRNA 3-end processing factor
VKRAVKREERAVWRNGVQLTGTPIWCDARATRDVNFVSHAGAYRPGRQIICTEATALRLGARAPHSALRPPYARPFSLGDLRVELYPSGLTLGGASLVVDVKGERVAYAGSVAPWAGELRTADAVVLDTRWSHPRYRFPPRAQAEAALDAFVAAAHADRAVPVLLVEPTTVGFELVDRFGELPVLAHRAIERRASSRARLPGKKLAEGAVVVWPLGKPVSVANARVALVDASALDPGAAARVDAAIPWSDRAGHDELVAYVVACAAARVYALGGADPAFVSALAARGVTVSELGPPAQLSLF